MEEVMQRTLANNIRKARLAKNLSRNELAEMIQAPVFFIEGGLAVPSLTQLVHMADIFGCSIDWLLGREEKEKKETGVSYEELLDAFLNLFNILVDVKKVFAKAISEFDDAILSNNEKAVTVLEKLVKSEVVTTDDEKEKKNENINSY